MSKILTLGTFDLLHVGHIELFRFCRLLAGTDGSVVVAVNPSDFVAQFKPQPPVQSLRERMGMVRACRFVDAVMMTPGQDAKPLIETVKPQIIVIGSDWASRGYHAQLQITPQYLEEKDIFLTYLDRSSVYSSTELKERIRGKA